MPAKINVDKLQEGLNTKRFGKSIFFTRQVDSTNQWAKQLAKLGAEEGAVTIAETQTHGYGRLDREWVSPPGGLWFSVILRPKLQVGRISELVFVAGLAVAGALSESYDLAVKTKWPNDVLIDRRKVCGILTEMNTIGETANYAIVGIGVNANFDVSVFPENIAERATSLQSELGKKVKLENLLRTILERFENYYDLSVKYGYAQIIGEWKKSASFLNRLVEVRTQDERLVGSALDVDEEGALILRLEDGATRRVFVGDVSIGAK